jgi:hypothetical protein
MTRATKTVGWAILLLSLTACASGRTRQIWVGKNPQGTKC